MALACGIISLASSSSAQVNSSRIEQARQFESGGPQAPGFRATQPALSGERAPSTPGDSDLGEQWILKEQEKYRPFLLIADVTGLYTTNAALTRRDTQGDSLFVGTAGVSYQPRLTRNLLAEFTITQGFYRYGEFTALDFNSLNVGGGLTYGIHRLWDISITARYNYNLLTDTNGDEFFHNNTLTIGLQKNFVLTKSHYFYVGQSNLFGFAAPRSSQRNEFSLYGGYHLRLTRSLETELYYRLSLFDYAEGGRRDLNQILGTQLSYNFTPYLTLYASVSLGFNNSNESVYNFTTVNSGGTLSLNWRF